MCNSIFLHILAIDIREAILDRINHIFAIVSEQLYKKNQASVFFNS